MTKPSEVWNDVMKLARDTTVSDNEVRGYLLEVGPLAEADEQALNDYIEITQAVGKYLLTERKRQHAYLD
jgi:hypothetical protein